MCSLSLSSASSYWAELSASRRLFQFWELWFPDVLTSACPSSSSHQLEMHSVQFSSVAQSCLTLCDPMNHNTPGLPVHHHLLESTRTHVHGVGDVIQPSHSLSSPSPPVRRRSFPASGSFPMSQLFAWGSQSIGVSALASVLPMNTQDWYLGWTGWISLQSKGLSRVFTNTTVQKHQFFGTQLSSQSNSHIRTWLLEKPQPWLDRPLLAK